MEGVPALRLEGCELKSMAESYQRQKKKELPFSLTGQLPEEMIEGPVQMFSYFGEKAKKKI